MLAVLKDVMRQAARVSIDGWTGPSTVELYQRIGGPLALAGLAVTSRAQWIRFIRQKLLTTGWYAAAMRWVSIRQCVGSPPSQNISHAGVVFIGSNDIIQTYPPSPPSCRPP